MSELQMGLLALGGVAVLGVFVYNKWQERQHRKVAERVFQQPGEDVLLDRPVPEPVWQEGGAAQRQEPVLAPIGSEDEEWARHEAEQAELARKAALAPELPAEPAAAPGPAGGEPPPWDAAEPGIDRAMAPDMPPSVPELSAAPAVETGSARVADLPLPANLLSPSVDAIAILEMVERVPATQVLASQREALARLRKPLRWVGFNETRGEWEAFGTDSQESYRRLRVGLQLADRQGPVSAGDFTLFAAAMQQLGDELMAVLDLPSSQQVLDQARQLDGFCAGVDMQIGVNLVSRGTPFAGTKIRALAESAGMVLGTDGVYVRHDDEGLPLFSLQNFEAAGFAPDTLKSMSTHGLVFLLDVPRVPRGQHVYTQMVELARRFGETLNGVLVDDHRKPLAEPQLQHIRQEYVIKPQAAMEARGIPAGGALALRLFN
ncbi:cell division protein ZipA C-terminal FtsZ-binding domain-containing protein [Azovibrio restrictus]|uniref:cell division protein ZipA C-terminal FtsZ-binding domain-containing protein n=1 Tax=Azovibrio restrictus TaxID=146938 RepID=UPI0026EB2B7E|nr:cell division protein ZipA C-terminal FtsZ-binding domain-containing protein [Azovibrio restrictus]